MKRSVASEDPRAPRFLDLYMPKLVTVLREGYGLRDFRADAVAGLTVAIVALPLSIAIAIASGATPAQGLVTAIVGGFLVSALGGSRFQIGGPAGAFIVLVGATVAAHGMDGLILAVILSGVLLIAAGLLRLGDFVKFVPYPVTVGFTAGIAVIIAATQIRDFFGLSLAGPEPGPIAEKLAALGAAAQTMRPEALAIGVAALALIFALRRLRPHWPGILIAVVAATLVTAASGLDVDTIGSRFGEMPAGLPAPELPALSWAKVVEVLPAAFSFALLGSIESLLSAVVADGMTGRRHRSNCELVGQGVANIGSGLFGGLCVTGTIARTATNVRAGARSPVAGMLHGVFVLAIMAAAAPVIGRMPMAALAAVLMFVAWNMFEKHAFARLLRASRGDAAVLLVTFGLTVFRDLTEAIVVGFALGALLFIHRMSQAARVEFGAPLMQGDRADDADGDRTPYPEQGGDRDIVVFRLSGAFFFGAAASIGSVLDRIGEAPRALVIDLGAVPFVDSSGANAIEGLVDFAGRKGARAYVTGLAPGVARTLAAHGLAPPRVAFAGSVEEALAMARGGPQDRD